MSVKNNLLLTAAALAVGVTVTANAGPVAEGLLNDYRVTEMSVAQVDDSGRCIVFVTVVKALGANPETRPVGSAAGDVKLFSDFGAVSSMIKRAKLDAGVLVEFSRKVKSNTVGDPIATLKSQYKAMKAEYATSVKNYNLVLAKITAGEALGWDEEDGTPKAIEYADYLVKRDSISEWNTFANLRKDALAASLTAAGVDPATVI